MKSTGQSFYEGAELEALATMERYYDWIESRIGSFIGGRTLEVGAGTGTFASRLRRYATRMVLVEPSKNLSISLQERFASDRAVKIVELAFEDYCKDPKRERFDSVVLVNVLEHIEDDLVALENIRQFLVPGGHLALFVPALPQLFSELDRRFGHFRRYTRQGLVRKVERAGFEVEVADYFDLFGVFPWYLLHTLGGRTSLDVRLLRFYDRYFIPIARRIEARVRPSVGKNVLLVARRR